MDAIVYQSHTGHSKQYAELLGKKINLPVYSLKEAKSKLKANSEIIFFGWLMAGNASGYDKAHKRYNVRGLCAVGMCADTNNKQLNDLEKKYRPYLDYEGLPYLSKGTRWQYQSHIYENPFYYIDYCLAQVVAFEFLQEMQKDYDGALKRYMDHCKRGGKYPFNKLVFLAGLKSPFEDGALDEVAEVAKEIIATKRK